MYATRPILTLGAMAWAVGLTVLARHYSGASDFSVVWAAAHGLIDQQNPYDVVGPGRSYPWAHTLLYPFPAVLMGAPFALLPLWLANALFAACGAGLLAWGFTKDRVADPRLLVFLSLPYFHAGLMSQWSPLLVGAALITTWAWLLPCKPTIGIPLFLMHPTRQKAILCATMVVASLAIWPEWPWEWRASIAIQASSAHISAPVLQPLGWLLLTPLVFWRHPSARLVAILACVPQSPFIYEAVVLFLVVRTWGEGAFLWLTTAAWLYVPVDPAVDPTNVYAILPAIAPKMMVSAYLPAAAIVLRQGWLERRATESQSARSELPRPPSYV